jgi:hypothetical protein
MKFVMVKASINIDIFGAHGCRSALTSSMKFVMVKAGINIDIFGAHGCRSALTSSMISFVYRYTFVSIEEVEADRQLCAPKISMSIPALAAITDIIEEVNADRQPCAPKISMLIPALTITNFIEEVKADRY